MSVLLRYTIKQNRTAIDIQNMSMVTDEEEVLILPFSVFQVKDRIQNYLNIYSTVSVEIILEECEDDQQIISEQSDERIIREENDKQINREKQKSE